MPAPYGAEEIAAALMAAAERAGSPPGRFTVVADETARLWLIRVEAPGVEARRLTFPFASARGIYTPAEIASHVLRGGWPFG